MNTELFEEFRPRQTKLGEQVADRVQEFMNSGRLKPGDDLPAERNLAVALGVSRSTLREALQLLRERGLVEPKPTGGMRVVEIHPETVGAAIERYFLLRNCTHTQLQDVRRGIEPVIAAEAAKNATKADLAEIKKHFRILSRSWMAKETKASAVEDAEFHLAIAVASHNPLALAIFHGFRGLLHKFMLLQYVIAPFHEESFRLHRTITEAIVARDPERAAAAMLDHFRTSPRLDDSVSI